MTTLFKRIKNTYVGIFVLILCTVIGFFSKEAMCGFSRFILYGWCIYAVAKTVQWVAADSKHWEKKSRKEMNTIFLGALFPMVPLLAGYSSIVTEAGQDATTRADMILFNNLSSVNYAVSSLLPALVLVVCVVIVNFGAGIKAHLFKRGKEKDKKRKEQARVERKNETRRQQVQNKINKANDKAIVSMATADARITTARTEAAVNVAQAQGKRISMLAAKSAAESTAAIPGAVAGGIVGGVKDGLTADTAELHQLAQQLNSGTQGVGELPTSEVPQIEVKEI